jgi:predicted transcriptional regulator of viral defense system
VISHDTALDLWDLCDVNPAKVHVTVPAADAPASETSPANAIGATN